MANSPVQFPQPAWILDIVRAGTTYRAASRDFEAAADVTALGAVYTKRIKNAGEIVITDELSDEFAGIDNPATATIILDNSDSAYSTLAEWRNCAVTLKHYEASTQTLTTQLTGVITEFDFLASQFIITISTHDPSIWETLIPRALTNYDEFPSASDNGMPIPVPFGPCFISPAYCGRDEATDPGGYDFLVGFQNDQDGTSMGTRVTAVYSDTDPNNPGLELLTGWDGIPGTPTYASGTTFTLTGDLRNYFQAGTPIRLVTTASAGAWVYATVSIAPTYSSGTGLTTVTVTGVTLDSGMNTGASVITLATAPTAGGTGYAVGDVLTISGGTTNATVVVTAVSSGVVTRVALKNPGSGYSVADGLATTGGTGTGCTVEITAVSGPQLATEYLTENARYQSGSENLLSVRTFVATSGGLVVKATSTMTNPATVIKEIMRNATWGLGQSVDATTFATAATNATNAGLGACVANALGGDRQQRRAGEVIRELLLLIGGRLVKNPTDGEWELTTDLSAPAAAAVTFGYGDGTYNNIKSIESNRKSSLQEAVSVLALRFGPSGRVKRSTDTGTTYTPGNYQLTIEANVLSVGHEEFVTTPWLSATDHAARVLARIAKAKKFGDQKPIINVGQEGRAVTVGQLVHYENPIDGIDADFRVRRIERTLTNTKLYLAGYDASIFTYSASDTTTVNDELDADERHTGYGAGSNLLTNSDFSAGPRGATYSTTIIPFWKFSSPLPAHPDIFTLPTVDIDNAYVGGSALSIPVSDVSSSASFYTTNMAGNIRNGIAVQALRVYIASVYADSATGWSFTFFWFYVSGYSILGSPTPILRIDPSDVNGKGWKRYYGIIRAPADRSGPDYLAYASLAIQFGATGTYAFDAVQFEEASGSLRPTIWKRHTKWGIDPALLQTGDLTIRASGEVEHGTIIAHNTVTVNTTSGTQVTVSNLIPTKCQVIGISTRITTAITGAPAWNIGYADDLTAWGANLPPTIDSTSDIADATVVNPVYNRSASAMDGVISSTGAAFSGGAVKVTCHYMKLVAPTS